ncbi:MAG: 3-deoxy-manno-octulosonate cytidylyltransferase, partial [Thiotrichales bacterium]
QLRLIENNYPITAVKVTCSGNYDLIGVDTPHDAARVEKILNEIINS